MLAAVPRISEAGSDLQDHGCAVRAGIEDVSREGQLPVLQSYEESTLYIQPRRERFGALRHTAKVQPLIELIGDLRPVVIEVSRLRGCIENVFVVDGKVQFLPGERSLTARSDAVRSTKHPADHRRHFKLPGLAP